MFVLSSVTDSVVTFGTDVIRDLGLGGVFVLAFADGIGIPVPVAAIMLFAGFDVSAGHLSLAGVIAAGAGGDFVGCMAAYGLAAWGGPDLVQRLGRRSHV